MQRAHIYISGFVQGVGFRQFVAYHAKKLKLTGWVRNLPARNASVSLAGGPDGRVEAVVVGDKKNVEEIIRICKKGPLVSQVENVEVVWEEPEEKFSGFEILK